MNPSRLYPRCPTTIARAAVALCRSAGRDPAEELAFAMSLINRVVDGVTGVRTGVHVCRGDWSRNEATLLRGNYQPLVPYLARLRVDQLVLEYATDVRWPTPCESCGERVLTARRGRSARRQAPAARRRCRSW